MRTSKSFLQILSNFEEDYAEEASLSNFLEEISLQTDIDNYDAEADSSVMMTLHSAKGLEFPVVSLQVLKKVCSRQLPQ